MTKKQESKNVGIIFLIVLLLNIAISALELFLEFRGISLGVWSTVLVELFIFIPVFVYLKMHNEPFFETLGFHKIKISTIILTIALNIVITPIWVFGNLFSQLFVPNTFSQAATGMISNSGFLAIAVVSFMPPIFEEILCRGFIFNKYRKTSSILSAALFSGLLFGILHLNINQFCYAFLIGVIFAMVNVASGSIFTSMILHLLINGFNMLMLYASMLTAEMTGVDGIAQAEASRQTTGRYIMVAIMFVVALLFALLTKKLMQVIAKNEGHLDEFNSMFKKAEAEPEDKASVFTVPSVVSVILGAVVTLFISFVLPTLV